MRLEDPGRTGGARGGRVLLWLLAPSVLSAMVLVYAIAALLNVDSPALGAATIVTAACDTDGLTATPSVSYGATAGGYVVDEIALAGLANSCRNNDFIVSLFGAGGPLAESSLANVPVGSFGGTNNNNTLSLSFTSASPRVTAADVTSIHVVITN